MNFVVKHDGVDISDHTIEYSRFQFICTGIGTIDIVLENKELGRTIIPWDKIELWEEGNKVGKYIISTVIKSADGGTLTLKCQDYSKKLVEHFVTDTNIVDYPTTTKYWIEKFLQEADLDYEFTAVGDGEIVGPNASYGMSSAYDLVVSLLQQSGWYIYFDQNGKAIVGNLEKAGDSYDSSITDNDILLLERNRNDQRLRNRAVVWGSYDPVTGGWIEADLSVTTPWNYDSNDKRAVVFSNGMVYTTTIAEDLARKILNEFSKIGNEIRVEIINHYGISLGDRVFIKSKHFNGRMLVTTIESRGNKDGLVVTLTLNQKCPRLFAYFATLGDFIPVYIGTSGAGVWKKYTGSSVWTDVSTGLDDLYIVDLFVKQGVLACIAGNGYLYTSDITTNVWTKFNHGDLIDLDVNLYFEPDTMLEPSTRAVCCSIDDSGNIVVGYVYNDPEDLTNSRSWIVTISGDEIVRAEQIILEPGAEQGIRLVDLESIGNIEEGNIVSINKKPITTGTYIPGTRDYQDNGYFFPAGGIDPNAYSVGPYSSGTWAGSSYIGPGGNNFRAGFIIENDDTCWYMYMAGSKYRLVKADLTTLTILQTYDIDSPSINTSYRPNYLYKYSDFVFYFVHFELKGANLNTLEMKLFKYTLGDTQFTLLDTITESYSFSLSSPEINFIGSAIKNHIVTYSYWVKTASNTYSCFIITYDVLSKSYSNNKLDLITGWTGSGDVVAYRPYFASNGLTIDTGFLYLKETRTIPWGNSPSVEFRIINATVTSYGGYQSIDKVLKTWETSGYDSIINDTASFGDVFYAPSFASIDPSTLNRNIASDSTNSYVYGEIALRRKNWGNPSLDQGLSIIVSLRFPDLLLITKEKEYSISTGYYDYTSLHMVRNNAFLYHGGPDTSEPNLFTKYTVAGINSRTNNPLFMKYNLWDSADDPVINEHYIAIVDAKTLDVSTLLPLSTYFTINQEIGPIIQPGYFRDDATGHWYVLLTPQPTRGVTGDKALYAFTQGCAQARKIKDFPGPPHIVKTHAMDQYAIRNFVDVNSMENAPQIVKHTSMPFDPGLIGASVDAREQTYGIYEVILEPEELTKVEISKGAPTVIYSTPNISGPVTVPPTAYLAASLTNFVNDFYLPPPNLYNFYDTRVFDIPNPHLFYVEQGGSPAIGILPEALLERYVGLAVSGELAIIRYDFNGEFYPVTTISGGLMTVASGLLNPSGAITTFETTNYTLDPYLFIGVSGPPAMFFQRNPLGAYFYSYSSTLPSGVDITIIRVDDDI